MEVLTNIPQKSLIGNEETKPELSDIRKLLEKSIPTVNVTDEDIKFWLQAPPTLSKETKSKDGPGKADSLCEKRAKELASTLKPSSAEYQPRLFTSTFSPLAKQWEGVDKTLETGTPVIIKGLDTLVGGKASNFKSGKSHHVVLFLAAGTESEGDFYIGYDPDISATKETRAAWETAITAKTNNKIISDLILGTSGIGLGPLCRKYYIDKKCPFPPIKRL